MLKSGYKHKQHFLYTLVRTYMYRGLNGKLHYISNSSKVAHINLPFNP